MPSIAQRVQRISDFLASNRKNLIYIAAIIIAILLWSFLLVRANAELPPGQYIDGAIQVDVGNYLNANCVEGELGAETTASSGWPPAPGGTLPETDHTNLYKCSHDGPSLDAIILLLLFDVLLGSLIATMISGAVRRLTDRLTNYTSHLIIMARLISILFFLLVAGLGLYLWIHSSWTIRYAWTSTTNTVSASIDIFSNLGKMVGPALMASGIGATWDALRSWAAGLAHNSSDIQTG